MKKQILILCLLLGLSVLFWPQQEFELHIRGGIPAIPLGIPQFIPEGTTAELKEAASTLHDIFQADMTYSRVFQPLPRTYYDYIKTVDPDDINFKDWESVSAKLLVVGIVSPGREGGIVFDARAYDVRSERFIFGKRYEAPTPGLLRLAAHKLSDEMMRIYGEPPVFTSKIVFISNRDGNDEIYKMDYDGHNQTRITFNKVKDYMPAWSPDGRNIAYTSYHVASARLYILNPYEGKRTRVEASGTNWSPCFSPDGRWLAFSSTLEEGNSDIYKVTSDGQGRLRKLTFSKAIDTAPSYSPNGRQIAFTSDRSGSPQIYVMDAEGGNVRRVSFGGSYHDAPAWSPDGDRIAYVSRVDQIFDIYILNLRTQQIVKLTESYARNEFPSWSPDGRHLVFTSTRTGKSQIYTMDYDGKNVRMLTNKGDNKLPDWSK